MHFCSKCSNMYYINISENDNNKLVYFCKNCGNKDDTIISDGACVLKTQLRRTEQKYTHIVNKYTKHDNTLPRTNNIKCPNQECPSNKENSQQKREILFIRYDDANKKYLYMCTSCDKMWKSAEQN